MKRRNTLILETIQDENTGEYGLALADMHHDETNNAATSGLLLAHDIIEHVNGPRAIGTIADELEALGAIWYVCGQHGELNRDGTGSRYTIHQNIASDVSRMFRDHFYGQDLPDAPRTRACDADADLREILQEARPDSLTELDSEDKSKRETKQRLARYLKNALSYMRIGYRKAVAKYERHGSYFANNLFWAISDATDRYAKNAGRDTYHYELVYGIDKNGSAFARCDEHYPEDDYA